MSKLSNIGRRPSNIESLESRTLFSVILSDSVSILSPASHTVLPGRTVMIAIAVSNSGDTEAVGKIELEFGLSPNADGSSPTTFLPATEMLHLKLGPPKIFRIPTKIPVGYTPGAYFATAVVDATNMFGPALPATSANTVTVLDPFPNLVGSWSGTVKITRGFDKGVILNRTDVFSTESDTTGGFTGTATTDLSTGAVTDPLTGSISTTGVFNDSSTSSAGTSVAKGRLAGHTLHLTFKSIDNSGTITLMEDFER